MCRAVFSCCFSSPSKIFFFLVHLNAAQSTLIAVLSSLLKETRRISQLKSRMSAGTGNAFSCSCRGRKLGWGSCREKYLLKYSEVPLPPALPELRAVFICLLCFMNSVDFSIIIPPVSECEGGEWRNASSEASVAAACLASVPASSPGETAGSRSCRGECLRVTRGKDFIVTMSHRKMLFCGLIILLKFTKTVVRCFLRSLCISWSHRVVGSCWRRGF